MGLASIKRTTHEQRRLADSLEEAARAADRIAELDVALGAFLEPVMSAFDADRVSIQLLDRAKNELTVVAARGLDSALIRSKVALGQGISGRVAATREPALLRSLVDVERFAGHAAPETPIHASVCVPIADGERILGVLSVARSRPGSPFDDDDLRDAIAFARHAAVSILRDEARHRLRRRERELAVLSSAGARLARAEGPKETAEVAIQEALALTGAHAAVVLLADAEGRAPTIVRYAGFGREDIQEVLRRAGSAGIRPPATLEIVTDIPAHPIFGPAARSAGDATLLTAPIRAHEGTAGVLAVAVPRAAAEDAAALFDAFAAQTSLALTNQGLREDVTASEEELDTLANALDIPVVILDGEGRFRTINMAAAVTLRLSAEHELGRFASGRLPEAIEEVALEQSEDGSVDVRLPQAGDRMFRVTAATVRDARGAAARIILLTDLTRGEELEQRKEDFLAVIGHELRTPLTSIKGFARTLSARGDTLPAPARAEAIATIAAQADRLERLIEDLLYISGVEQVRPPVRLSWEDLRELCGEIIRRIGGESPSRIVRFAHPGGDVPVYTDRVKVEQIVSHLLDNALKFSPEDALVTVRLDAEDDTVALSVIDDGPGIPSADLERVFEPFVQLDGTATRTAGGTGIGLYVCAMLADALSGAIEVESALGRGSTFTFLLPRTGVDTRPA
ncbi:MAG TPA: ATP-binding protein [Actinomycetota bacterium]